MSGFTRVKSPAALPTYVTITNSNFSANNTTPNSQIGFKEFEPYLYSVPGWPKNGEIETGTANERANDVRLLNYLTNNNASPRFWNATLSSGGGNITTCFWVGQNSYSTATALQPIVFSISQTITIESQGTYTARFWAAPRTGDALSGLSTNAYNPSQSVSMYVGSEIIGTKKTFTQTNGNYPGFELVSGTFTTSAANQSRTIRFDWSQTSSSNSSIMITGIEIYK
jgi:hypothetical protein